MLVLEDIFYTNLTEDLTQFIAEIRQKEIIDEYTIFVIYDQFHETSRLNYFKFWKSRDCIILDIKDHVYYRLISSNKKYLWIQPHHTFDEFKKICSDYDLLEKHIKFTYNYKQCALKDGMHFNFQEYHSKIVIRFNCKLFTVNEFIEEILTTYPECYKYDYSQIKPAIGKSNLDLAMSNLN